MISKFTATMQNFKTLKVIKLQNREIEKNDMHALEYAKSRTLILSRV